MSGFLSYIKTDSGFSHARRAVTYNCGSACVCHQPTEKNLSSYVLSAGRLLTSCEDDVVFYICSTGHKIALCLCEDCNAQMCTSRAPEPCVCSTLLMCFCCFTPAVSRGNVFSAYLSSSVAHLLF